MAAPVAAIQGVAVGAKAAKEGVHVAVKTGGLVASALRGAWERMDDKARASTAMLAFLAYNKAATWWNDWQTDFADSTVGQDLKWRRIILPVVKEGTLLTGKNYPNPPPSPTQKLYDDSVGALAFGPLAPEVLLWETAQDVSGPLIQGAEDIAKLTTWW